MVRPAFDDTPEGDLAFNIMGRFARYEKQLIRTRSMKGKRKRAEEGQQPQRSTPAYGYHMSPTPWSSAAFTHQRCVGDTSSSRNRRALFVISSPGMPQVASGYHHSLVILTPGTSPLPGVKPGILFASRSSSRIRSTRANQLTVDPLEPAARQAHPTGTY